MRILTRYVLREFAKVFGLCVAALLGLYYVVDVFDRIEIFIEYQAPVGLKLAYFLLKLPFVLYQVTPVALLVTTVVVLGILARNNELTAVKAAGVSLHRVTLPLVVFALGVSCLIFLNNEFLLPPANEQAYHLLNVRIKGRTPRGLFRQTRVWYAGRDGRIYNIQVLDPRERLMEGVTVYRFGPRFRPLERIDAMRARPVRGGWMLEGAVRRLFGEGGRKIRRVEQRRHLMLAVPDDFQSFYKYKRKPDEMDFFELRRYVRELSRSGFNAVPYRVDLQFKAAVPFIGFVVSFLAVAVAVRADRRGGIMAGIGICIALTVAYWLLLSVSLSLGRAGRLPPGMAAWAANILFLSAGLSAYANLRQ